MCDDRLPWPERAAFLRVVADGDYEVKNVAFVFVPGLRTSCGSVHLVTLFKDTNGVRINERSRVGSGAKGFKPLLPKPANQVFAKDAARTIARAQE